MLDEASLHFGWADYLIFTLTLVISLIIGVYYARKGAASSTSEYLFGGKSMGIFPIAMSFAASSVSSQSMLGVPTDVYLTGAMMLWWPISLAIGVLISSYVYLPLFQDLGILSINQYLELRFHRLVRRLFSAINIFGYLFYLAIITYGPSLALSQVTGLNVYLTATITFAVCTFYTTIGGMKAVVWSDTVQIILMMASMTVLVIKGVVDVGIENVWTRNRNSGRLEFFNIDPDPTTQKTVWSMLIGSTFFWAGGYGTSQGNFQRFLAVPTRRHAQKALTVSIFVDGIFLALCCFAGLVAYSRYFDCDPIKAKLIAKADQIVPYFVMDTFGSIPGLSGLFIAGVFSASLSTLSTVISGISLTILEDFVRPFFPNLTDEKATKISKLVSFGFGLISYALVFIISNVKTIFETGSSFSGAVLGMSFGIFTLGMLVPWANSIGAAVGMLASYLAILLLGIFTQAARSQGTLLNNQLKPTTIENCYDWNSTTNSTLQAFDNTEKDEAFILLRISFMWYTMIGTLIVIIIGTMVSLLTGRQDPYQLDPKLCFRFLRRWINKKRTTNMLEVHQMTDNKGFEPESI